MIDPNKTEVHEFLKECRDVLFYEVKKAAFVCALIGLPVLSACLVWKILTPDHKIAVAAFVEERPLLQGLFGEVIKQNMPRTEQQPLGVSE